MTASPAVAAPDVAAHAADFRARRGAAWRAAGTPPLAQLREALAGLPAELREAEAPSVLLQLVAVHQDCSWGQGHGKELEEYMVEFGRDFVEFASLDTVPA